MNSLPTIYGHEARANGNVQEATPLWHSVYAAETSCLLLEQSSIWLTSNSRPNNAILALIALVTGPNSTQLRLVQFMPVTCAINAMLLIIHIHKSQQSCWNYSLQT